MGLSNELSCELGVSPPAPTPTGFYFPSLEPWVLWSVSLPSCSPSLSACKCGTAWSASHCLAGSPLCSGFPSPALLPVFMNVSLLTPWLSDFHIVLFYGSFCYFLFLNLLLSFFLLCKEAQCIYLHLHLGQKSKVFLSLTHPLSLNSIDSLDWYGSVAWALPCKVKGCCLYTYVVRAHAWSVGLIPGWGMYERQLIDVSLSHWCLSSSFSKGK